MDDLDDLEKKTMQIFGGRTDGRDGDGDGVREEGEYGKERGRVREVREGGINQLASLRSLTLTWCGGLKA